MVGCLIFIASFVTGGGIAVILLSCLQINRIDKYESKTNKFRTDDNKNITYADFEHFENSQK